MGALRPLGWSVVIGTKEAATHVLSKAQRQAVRQLLRIAPVADELGARFQAAGHELALVGGSVRDALLDRLGQDLDFTTSARPEETKRLLAGWTDNLWDVGQKFGTIGGTKDGFQIEVTTYRADSYDPTSRKPAVAYGTSITDDLVRRDFTVNAMAVLLPGREFVDPHGGLADLGKRLIRTPGTPEQSFSDDPLRMMRAARFASQLGFEVAPEVVAAMTDMAGRIEIVSAERVRDELTKLLLSPTPRTGLTLLVDTGIAGHVLPELPALRLEIDEHHRHKDVYEHSLTVLEQAIELERRLPGGGPDLVARLAALLHDIGKPRTRKFEPGGGVSFHHHDVVGAKLVRKRLTALRYPSAVIDSVADLIQLHLRFHGYGGGEWTDSAVRRYVRDAGDELERLHVLTRADCTTRNRRKALALQQSYDSLEERITRLAEEEELAAIRPDLDGNQIMQILGIAPGPLVGRAYHHMLEVRLDHGVLPEDEARAELLRWWGEQPEGRA
ncbi:CCA tRNA nucleotidyltransferase [Jiangella mangrovi]|uniref:CCA tRNA nucleotidyltransferase n=1 Tax=Jiangella mangrovi TaxID=1524084 RepID=UPI0016178C9A|nr:CCA tRNA nucleotidyltransferase [Jiangella mangrovi]